MCRIDAIAVNGFEDALGRAKAAVDLGVDMIFVEALETREQMGREREITVPLMLNLIEGGRTPLVTYKKPKDLGSSTSCRRSPPSSRRPRACTT